MKQITNFIIDSSDLLAATSSRDLTISGDPGSKFVLYISNENPQYYNFTTDTFGSEESKFVGEIPSGGRYIKKITFPTVTDDDKYDFQLIANPHNNVELSEGLSTNSIYYRTSIEQKTDSILTLAVATTTSGDFQTMPTSVTLTKPPLNTDENLFTVSWTIKAVDAITGGALEITRQPLDTDFKFTTIHESIGSGSSDTVIYLDSVENLTIGMSLTTIESGSVLSSPTISSINKTLKSVTVTAAQSWATAKDITFKGGGIANISKALNTTISFSDLSVALTPFTATVTPAISSTTDVVCSTVLGIRAGSTYTGIGVNNETTQYVTGITYGSNSFSTTSAQTLKNNTILTFEGCAQEAVIKAKVKVTKMPKDDVVLTLDLDSILTSALT
jgi:hypothetical protein